MQGEKGESPGRGISSRRRVRVEGQPRPAALRGQAVHFFNDPETRAGMAPEIPRHKARATDDVTDESSGLRTGGGDFEIPWSEKNS